MSPNATVARPDVSARACEIMGMRLERYDEAETVQAVFARVGGHGGGWMVNPNLDVLRQYSRSPEVRELLEGATLAVADGMPLVWASALAGCPLPARVAGSTLIYDLSEEAGRRQASVFFLGGAPGTAAGAAEVLAERCPGMRIAGTYCPPFGFEDDPALLEEICDTVRSAGADLVFVALGFPKQERLVTRLRTVAPNSFFVCVGISFSFVTGEVARAPEWIQQTGFEWLYRLSQEPGRLWRRYLLHDIPFALQLLTWAAYTRLTRRDA